MDDALEAALGHAMPASQHTGPRKKPQRNPAFSTTSRLVVLRDPPAPSASPATAQRDPRPAKGPAGPSFEAGTPEDTPPPTRTCAQHDLVLSAYESRSHWHKQRTRGESSAPLVMSTTGPSDASPPSFFSEMFPERAPRESSPAPPPALPVVGTSRPASPVAEVVPAPASPASLRSLSPECELPTALPTYEAARRVASRVEIRGWRRVGTPMHGWVVYDIHLTTPSVCGRHSPQGHDLHMHKRYRAFLELAHALAREYPQHAAALPPLPPRHTGLWQRYHPAFLEGRRRALQAWLDTTAVQGPWGSSEALAAWALAR